MTTVTRTETTEQVLKKSDPTEMMDALRKVDLGTRLTPRKITFAALTSAAAQDITTAAAKAAATIVPALPDNDPVLLPIHDVISLRVTAGAAAAGPRTISDSGGTASATVALLSDDGKTLTFETTVTGFVLQYVPRPANDLTAKFAPSTYP